MTISLRLSCLLLSISFVSISLGEEHPWAMQPDPVKVPAEKPGNAKESVQLAFGLPRVEYSGGRGTFVALSSGDKPAPGKVPNADLIRVYDVRTLKPIGPSFSTPANFTEPHVLSTDGKLMAARAKGAHATMEIWASDSGKSLRTIEVDADPKRFAFPVDFISTYRLLTICHDAQFPDPAQRTMYQVWDVNTGKEITHFEIDLDYHWKWGAISPGGKYLAVEKTETLSGFQLLGYDLETGKRVGEIEFQDKKDTWGQACGMSFSPDGKELAMVWRLAKKPDTWGHLMVFDVETGKKIADHTLGYAMKNMDLALSMGNGSGRLLQWIPDGSGWLMLGYLLIDRKSGAVVGKLGKEPGLHSDVQLRRFVGMGHVTAVLGGGVGGKQVGYEAVTREK